MDIKLFDYAMNEQIKLIFPTYKFMLAYLILIYIL